jgi:quaternary ammonium compound-resistance protein SugE
MEVVWLTCLKESNGFKLFLPSVGVVFFMAASTVLLGVAIKQISIGTSYAVWTGMGAMGGAIVGILVYAESASPVRILGIVLIAFGVILLKIVSR